MNRSIGYQPRRSRQGARRAAPAFALPLVILLSLAAVILIAAMLERQGAQRFTNARAGDDYRETHFGRGVSEVIDTWLTYQGTRTVRDMLSADGKAMDIELSDGSALAISMRDAQGLLLSDTAGLSADDAADLQGALQHLAESVTPAQLRAMTRRFGPPAVSVVSAPVEVVASLAHQIAGAQNADTLLQSLLEIRSKSRPSAQDLIQAGTGAELDDTQRRALSRLFTVDSGFYRLIVDARAGNAGAESRPAARYGAYVLPRTTGGQRSRTLVGGVQRRSQIIGWERLEVP